MAIAGTLLGAYVGFGGIAALFVTTGKETTGTGLMLLLLLLMLPVSVFGFFNPKAAIWIYLALGILECLCALLGLSAKDHDMVKIALVLSAPFLVLSLGHYGIYRRENLMPAEP